MDDELSPEDIESLSEAMEEESGEETPQEEASTEQDPLENLGDQDLGVSDEEQDIHDSDQAQPQISHAQFMQLESPKNIEDLPMQSIERMHDIKVKVEVLLGKTKMTLAKILQLNCGSVVELNKLAGESVDILANGRLIARAEVVVIEDNFGIKIIEIAGSRHSFGKAHSA